MVDRHLLPSKVYTGKTVNAIILDFTFWSNCFMIAKIMAHIIKLLKIVDEEERPSMGYVYDGMQKGKKCNKGNV
jgi:hypothetical protein